MNYKAKSILLYLLFIIPLIIIDQITKLLAIYNLKDSSEVVLIPKVLELYYIENTGAAWGVLSNFTFIFVIISLVFIVFASIMYFRLSSIKQYQMFKISLLILIAGAFGNVIDRIYYHYVIDFIYFKLINFPVFNVADIFVTVSIIIIIFLLFFYYKQEDLDYIQSIIFKKNGRV